MPAGHDPWSEVHAEIKKAREEQERLRGQVSILATLVRHLFATAHPGTLAAVPAALTEALASPGRGPVLLHCHGRAVTAIARGGHGIDPAAAWTAIVAAVPQNPAGSIPELLSADLGGLDAIADGGRVIVASMLEPAERLRALRDARRLGRIAGVAVALVAMVRWPRRIVSRPAGTAGSAAGAGSVSGAGATLAASMAAVVTAGAVAVVTVSALHGYAQPVVSVASSQSAAVARNATGQRRDAGGQRGARAHAHAPAARTVKGVAVSGPGAAPASGRAGVTMPGSPSSPPAPVRHVVTKLAKVTGGTVGAVSGNLGGTVGGVTGSLGKTVGGVTGALGGVTGGLGGVVSKLPVAGGSAAVVLHVAQHALGTVGGLVTRVTHSLPSARVSHLTRKLAGTVGKLTRHLPVPHVPHVLGGGAGGTLNGL